MTYEISDLSVAFGNTQVLRQLTCRFPTIGVVALIGPNGAGKSTLLDVLAGFLKQDRGEIRLSQSNTPLSRSARQRLASRLHQVLLVPESISIAEYIWVAQCRGAMSQLFADRNGALAAYEHFLADHPAMRRAFSAAGIQKANRRIGELSWGQKRLVGIAAIVSTRKTLLLDEPLAGLSESVRESVVDVIQQEAADRLVVVAEHDLDVVRKVGNRILVLGQGKIVREYGQGELKENSDLLAHWWDAK